MRGIEAIECVDALEDLWGEVNEQPLSFSWNGRVVTIMETQDIYFEKIRQMIVATLYKKEAIKEGEFKLHHYEFLDLEEEIANEIDLHFEEYVQLSSLVLMSHPKVREIVIADPIRYQDEIIRCGSLLKKVSKTVQKYTKKVYKGAKKTVKEVKKGAKEVADFVKEHKKEILIGAAVVAVVAGAYVLAGALGGATTGLSGENGSGRRREDEDEPIGRDPDGKTPIEPPLENAIAGLIPGMQESAKIKPVISSPSLLTNAPSFDTHSTVQSAVALFLKNLGCGFNPENNDPKMLDTVHQFAKGDQWIPSSPSHSPSLQPLVALPETVRQWTEDLNQKVIKASKQDLCINQGPPSASIPEIGPLRSCRFESEGVKRPGIQIGFINGMDTSFEEHKSHVNHLKQFAGDLCIEGVYNHTNGKLVDILEIFFLNYAGIAPNTEKLLIENWTRFHEENKDNLSAKYLQFTHSMGTIQAKNALQNAPQEIRDRVVVVAIGPAVIIPDQFCYDSFHYASESDFVHYGENVFTIGMACFNDEEE